MEKPFVFEHLTIAGLRRAYEKGDLAPRAVAEAIIDRAGEYASYNVWIKPPTWDFMEPYLKALEGMDEAERAAKPLWGIPFAVKDNIDIAGTPTTAGCPAYAYTPKRDATVVANLIAAGAFPVGKTNLDQFATGLVGTRSPYGECHNALDPALISGGSSSGSAVAVALGMAAFSLGTDTAGSGRVPAALNGLVGFKPPLGSWSTAGVVPACASLDCVTVFARTLDDCEAVDAVASGPDEACAWSREFDSSAVGAFPRTVYVPRDEPQFYGDFAEDYRSAWHRSLEQLECMAREHGARFERIDTRWLSNIVSILYDGAWVAERWSDLGAFVTEHADDVFPVTRGILESGNRPDLTAADAFSAYHTVSAARGPGPARFSTTRCSSCLRRAAPSRATRFAPIPSARTRSWGSTPTIATCATWWRSTFPQARHLKTTRSASRSSRLPPHRACSFRRRRHSARQRQASRWPCAASTCAASRCTPSWRIWARNTSARQGRPRPTACSRFRARW